MAMMTTEVTHRSTFIAGAFVNVIARAFDVKHQRAVLKSLDYERLEDLGLNRKQAFAEARRLPVKMPHFSARSLSRAISHRVAVRHQRAVLKSLDYERLEDLGMNRKQAFAEAGRPVWNAPAHWKCAEQ